MVLGQVMVVEEEAMVEVGVMVEVVVEEKAQGVPWW